MSMQLAATRGGPDGRHRLPNRLPDHLSDRLPLVNPARELHRAPTPEEEDPIPGEEPVPDDDETVPHQNPVMRSRPLRCRRWARQLSARRRNMP